jgi:hypothetical protein
MEFLLFLRPCCQVESLRYTKIITWKSSYCEKQIFYQLNNIIYDLISMHRNTFTLLFIYLYSLKYLYLNAQWLWTTDV